ncbi:MAG: glycosyltransferase [Acidobacteria bacterium]|nr:glycosyltransferase [Acidobacteriota bacterium]
MRSEGPNRVIPLVSVVVATNRVSPFLDEALQSVVRQSYGHVEVIVVDDGSPQPEWVARAAGSVASAVLLRQPASGVAVARNRGAAQAKGDYLAFLDDDDRWHPRRLELQLESFQADPTAVLGYCGMQSIDESGQVIVTADQTAVLDEQGVARRNAGIILPNVLIRRDAFQEVGGFQPTFRLAEDLDLVLRLARRGRFVFTADALVDYRTHRTNTTQSYRELARSIDQVIRLHKWSAAERRNDALVAAHRVSLRANGRFAWWSALRAARLSLHEGRITDAIGHVTWAVRFSPLGLPDGLLRRRRRGR